MQQTNRSIKISPSEEQMEIVHQVAAAYWQQPVDEVLEQLGSTEVLKFTGGKVAGILPAYKIFPSVFFKVYVHNRIYRFESGGLQVAATMPPIEGVQVPNVIALMPEYKAILLEKRDWEDTSSPWKRLWVNKLGIDWFKVGAWLRAFHDSQTTYEKNDYFLRKKYEKFESHLNDLKHLFTTEQVEKMNHIHHSAKEYFEKNDCEWVISHGDFGLDNIKKSDSILEIIDFEDCQLAPREFDLLNFLGRMEFTGYFPNRNSTYAHISRQFLDGYGFSGNLKNPAAIFFDLLIKLDLIESYYRRRHSPKTASYQNWIYRYFEYQELINVKKRLTRQN